MAKKLNTDVKNLIEKAKKDTTINTTSYNNNFSSDNY